MTNLPKQPHSRKNKPILATPTGISGRSSPPVGVCGHELVVDGEAMQSGVRFVAKPDVVMCIVLSQWIGCQRVIYNGKVQEDQLFTDQRRMQLRSDPEEKVVTPLDRQYSQFKSDLTPWLSDVPSQILRNGSDRWFEGKQRQLKGLSKAPRTRNRNNFNSVLISNELFRFVKFTDKKGIVRTHIELGTYSKPVGTLPFHAHCAYGVPKQIVVRKTGNRWWVSFSYAKAAPVGFVQRSNDELAYELNNLNDAQLKAGTVGVDRNVKHNCVATSDGRFFDIRPIEQVRLDRKAKGLKRQLRRFAKCTKGSNNSKKQRNRIAAKHEYRSNLGRDFSHQTSHSLVNEPVAGTKQAPALIALENLQIANMTRRPKAKQDANGRWLQNGAAAKAGLHKAILHSCWGSIAAQVEYKSQRKNTLVLKVPAAYTSQGCSHCGHIDPDNRKDDCFVCTRCGFKVHADTNAGCNIASRAIRMIRDQKVVTKAKKNVTFRKRNKIKVLGQELPGVPAEGRVNLDAAQADNPVAPDEPGSSGRESS